MTRPPVTHEALADYLKRTVPTLIGPPSTYPKFLTNPYDGHWYGNPAPTVEELAEAFLADVEFRALRLGTWLGTAEGEVIAAAVQSVIPLPFRPEYRLLVEALKLAADIQHSEGQGRADLVARGVLVGTGLLLLAMMLTSRKVA